MARKGKSGKSLSHNQKSIPKSVKDLKRKLASMRDSDTDCNFCGSVRSFIRRLVVNRSE